MYLVCISLKMFAVVRYFNYRKDVSFTILKVFKNFKNAEKYALCCAEEEYGDEVVVGVEDEYVYMEDKIIEGYTTKDGHYRFVFTVIELPECESEDESEEKSANKNECESSESVQFETQTEFEFVKNNGMYEWGFDCTDFTEDEEYSEDRSSGAKKFSKLLSDFNMKLSSDTSKYYMWENEDNSLILITANNPLTGIYYDGGKSNKGYLSYTGVRCDSISKLQHFINVFRSYASYIKGESNVREYI